MVDRKSLIVITGSSGYLGTHIASLLREEYEVVGLDILPPTNEALFTDFIETDLSALENLKASLFQVREKHGGEIASVIHTAAYYNFTGGDWEKYQKITIDGTANLLTILQAFDVKQFVYTSTMLVHAPCPLGEKINEASPLEGRWEYPLSKIKAEEIIRQKRGKIPAVILRIAGVYDGFCNSIPLSQQILRIFEKVFESHLFPGNLNHGASYLHVEDFLHALKSVLEKREHLGAEEVFLLGEAEVMSYGQLQEEIGQLIHGKPWWTLQIPKWVAKMGTYGKEKLPFFKKSFIKPWMIDLADDHYDLEIHKAQRLLEWQPAHTLQAMLPKMIHHLKADPKKWFQEHEL